MDENKLLHNYHELSDIERAQYRVFVRPGWDEERRFFFEGDCNLIGQMYVAERRALYELILQRRPRHCFEVGTWSGGGSTYFISKAFSRLGTGLLYTLEAHPLLHRLAKAYYHECLPEQAQHVQFLEGGNVVDFETLIDEASGVDCFFLDGSDTPEQTLEQYRFFEDFIKPGTLMLAHDWNDIKQSLVRPLIEADARWRPLLRLELPHSVGFVACEYLG